MPATSALTSPLVLDTAPVGGALPDLIQIAGGDPQRVLTIFDFPAARVLGARDPFQEDQTLRFDGQALSLTTDLA